MNQKIYLDNNSTTAIDPRVLHIMVKAYETHIGNPSNVHSFGQEARHLLTYARRTIAQILGVKAQEIIFTSGGTEAINLILRGFFQHSKQGHVISTVLEHASVYQTLRYLEEWGIEVTYLKPGLKGAVSVGEVREAIRPNTSLLAIMAVNNETGVKTDINAIASLAETHQIPLFVDGVAWFGKELITIPQGVSALSLSAHKFHGPKGVGCAMIRKDFKFSPQMVGGGQEQDRRSGTENIPAIVGMAEAMRLIQDELPEAVLKMCLLRDRLEKGLKERLPGVIVNGEGSRICNTTNIAFQGVDGESLLMLLDLEGIAVSHGSACASGALEPSRVLLGMGMSRQRAASSIRFSLSRFTTEAEIDQVIEMITFKLKR